MTLYDKRSDRSSPSLFSGFAGAPQPPFPLYGQGTATYNGFTHPVPFFPGQQGGGQRFPNPPPPYDANYPASVMRNSTGGIGCEPGYNLVFAPEYTKVHVIRSRTAPWRIPPGMSTTFGAYHVPCNITLGEFLEGFGATNPTPRKNRITELTSGHSGRWYKGMTVGGDDAVSMAKTLKQMGWDRHRTGRPGEKPVVWLWITKD